MRPRLPSQDQILDMHRSWSLPFPLQRSGILSAVPTESISGPSLDVYCFDPHIRGAVHAGKYWFVKHGGNPRKQPELRSHLRLLFPANSETGPRPDDRHRICLCSDTICGRKDSTKRDWPECPRNAYSVCIDATLQANQGKCPPLRIFGILAGVSKQQIDKTFRDAQKSLITAVLADPELREYCENLGLAVERES